MKRTIPKNYEEGNFIVVGSDFRIGHLVRGAGVGYCGASRCGVYGRAESHSDDKEGAPKVDRSHAHLLRNMDGPLSFNNSVRAARLVAQCGC